MSRWFRHYAGMMRDPKFVRVALMAKQPVERVTFVWGCILESAAETNDGGRYSIAVDEIAYFLHCKATQVQAIFDQFEGEQMVSYGVVTKWAERQFESDTSASRTRRWRHSKRHANGHSDVDVTSHGDEM